MIHGNGTELKTSVGTFPTKYHTGFMGKIGSYSCKLSDIKPINKPKKGYIWIATGKELTEIVLRANRPVIEQTIFTYCALYHTEIKKAKWYVV
jgi:hypothetical protein